MYTYTTLKKRGWTDKLIKELLREPDVTATNPHYRKAAPMKLFDKTRVEQHENNDRFRQAQIGREKRMEAAAKNRANEVILFRERSTEIVKRFKEVSIASIRNPKTRAKIGDGRFLYRALCFYENQEKEAKRKQLPGSFREWCLQGSHR